MKITVNRMELLAALESTSKAAKKCESNILASINLKYWNDSVIKISATDGNVLFRSEVNLSGENDNAINPEFEFNLADHKQAITFLKANKNSTLVELIFNDTNLTISTRQGSSIVLQHQNGYYPKIEELIPKDQDTDILLNFNLAILTQLVEGMKKSAEFKDSGSVELRFNINNNQSTLVTSHVKIDSRALNGFHGIVMPVKIDKEYCTKPNQLGFKTDGIKILEHSTNI